MMMLGLITTVPYVQTAEAIGDVNENSATEFAPGIVSQSREGTSASELAPRAYGDPNEVGDQNIRAPGLLKQGEEFPGSG